MSEFSSPEFMESFLAEAGEHLQSIQLALLRLENALSTGENPAELLRSSEEIDELFRSFHTLKGLAGMVGLREAARLSHAMEAVLQALRKQSLPLASRVIDELLLGARVFEAITRAIHQPGEPAPEVESSVRALEGLLDSNQPAAASGEHMTATTPEDQAVLNLIPDLAMYPDIWNNIKPAELRKIQASAQMNHNFALVTFLPSPEKASRGENVDGLRRQIHSAGTLLKAVPVFSAGAVHFVFLVAMPGALDASQLGADEVIPLAARPPQTPDRGAVTGGPTGPLPETVVRVHLARLDDLMRSAGDLFILRDRLGRSLDHLEAPPAVRRELHQLDQQFGRSLRDLRRVILHARMVPLAETFNRMPLVVRDLARASEKDVQLVIEGETTEVDKALVERLLDPLIHLVRNAITHGIEPPRERSAAGKPAQGRLILRGAPEGDHILISVADDGRGIDLKRVQAKAVELGWTTADTPASLEDALEWITQPGFSTHGPADLAAGRGVGLDVVQKMVRNFAGQLSIQTTPGQGTVFILRLPLTLVILDALIVQVGPEQYAVPQNMVREIIEIQTDQIVRVESGELLPFRGGSLALRRLADLVCLPDRPLDPAAPAAPRAIGLLPSDNQPAALVVDRVLNLREVVMHTVSDPFVAQPGINGATELGDGRVMLILDLPEFFHRARQR